MQKLKALNTREKKAIYKQLESQFGHTKKIDAIFLINSQKKVYLLSNDYANLNLQGLRVNNKAMYFGKQEQDGFRLNIEGAQLIEPSKNIIELDKDQLTAWMMGQDIPFDGDSGYVILKYEKDVVGCAMHKNSKIRNMVPKERRLHSVTN